MIRRLSAPLFVALLVPGLVLTACSDDDGDTASDPVVTAGGGDQAGDNKTGPGGDGTCAGTEVSGTVTTGDETVEFTAQSAVAVSIEDGLAYTAYLADFDLDLDDISTFSNPEVAEGDTMFVLAATIFNAPDPDALEPIAVGDEIAYTDDFEVMTIRVTSQIGEELYGMSMDAEGTLAVTAVGDVFCGTIEYEDSQKTLSGTFEAPVKPL